MFNIL